MKKFFNVILIPTLSIFILPLIFTIFNLFKVEINPIIYLLSMIIISFITGVLTGLISNEKAYLKGIIVGLIFSIIMLLFSLLLKSKYTPFVIIYYLIIIITTSLGAMFGVNKKKG